MKDTRERNEDEKAIRDLIEARGAATRAGDARGVIEPFARHATCYELQPPLEFRNAAVRDRKPIDEWFETWEGPVEVELRDPTICVDQHLAFAFGLAHMQGKKKQGGQVSLWYRMTICFERQRGEWKVVHEHASVPFLMDGSEKAALDLKP